MKRLSVAVLYCLGLFLSMTGGAAADESNAGKVDAAKGGPFRLMSAEKDARLRSCFPQVENPQIQKMLRNPRLILYTEAEMPRAYQDWDGALQGVHSAYYNISADNNEPFGNGNREFPWGTPAGTHRSKAVKSFRFVWLPYDADGKRLPVVWYRKRLPRDNNKGYVWVFPVGTVFGEVLRLPGPDGKKYFTFEMRIRRRLKGEWEVDAFRPFPTADDLAIRIKQLRNDWQQDSKLLAFVDHLEQPLEMKSHSLVARHTSLVSFKQKATGVDSLPPLDADLVEELLTKTTFKSALGETWRVGSTGFRTSAPTTDAPFHIVPTKYDAGFIEVDRVSCMRCHDTIGRHVRDFQPVRDWYGRIRGSDGIFSFHPFARRCISQNGYSQKAELRGELVDAGLLEAYDADKHPSALYHRIKSQQ